MEAESGNVPARDAFNIAGDESFKLTEVVQLMLDMSSRDDIEVAPSVGRLRPIDADYQMFDHSKIKSTIRWKPEIKVVSMFQDLLDCWRRQIGEGRVPLNR